MQSKKRAKVSWTKIVSETEKQLKLSKATKKASILDGNNSDTSSPKSQTSDLNLLSPDIKSQIPKTTNRQSQKKIRPTVANKLKNEDKGSLPVKTASFSPTVMAKEKNRQATSSKNIFEVHTELEDRDRNIEILEDSDVFGQIEARQKMKSNIFAIDSNPENLEKKYVLTEDGPVLRQVFEHNKDLGSKIIEQDEILEDETGDDVASLNIDDLFKNPRSSNDQIKLQETFNFAGELETYRQNLDVKFQQVFDSDQLKSEITKVQFPVDSIEANIKHNIKVFDDIYQPPSGYQIKVKKDIAQNKNYSNRPIDLKAVKKKVTPLLEIIGGGIDQVKIKVAKLRNPELSNNSEEIIATPVAENEMEDSLGEIDNNYQDSDFVESENNLLQIVEDFNFLEFSNESEDEFLDDDIDDDDALKAVSAKEQDQITGNSNLRDFWGENSFRSRIKKRGWLAKLKVLIISLIISMTIIALSYLAIKNLPKYFTDDSQDQSSNSTSSTKNVIGVKFYLANSSNDSQAEQTIFSPSQSIMAKIIYQNVESSLIQAELINTQNNSSVFSNISFSITGNGAKIINMPNNLEVGEYQLRINGSNNLSISGNFTIE